MKKVAVIPLALASLVLYSAEGRSQVAKAKPVQLGPRPFYLVEKMDPSPLKRALQQCANGPFKKSNFSIGHRGACMQFPEHTRESYEAGARMGAGIVECDVTFTKDRELVCRHSQCDLHTTTNIVATDLAEKCTSPPDFTSPTPFKNVVCCTSDITLAEFKTLCGKMDASRPNAATVEEYMGGTANFRTDLYSTCGTLLTHAESIELFKDLGVGMTPELKEALVPMPYEGDYTQEDYAQQMIDEYKVAGVSARKVWPQSFNLNDVLYWIQNEPAFGKQAVYLDARVDNPSFDVSFDAIYADMQAKAGQGVNIVAPPMFALLDLDAGGKIVASEYALAAKAAGMDIITWTLERSGFLENAQGPPPTYYYQSVADSIDNDGDMFEVLDVLAKEVGILGIFSDWAATVTYYANCMGLK